MHRFQKLLIRLIILAEMLVIGFLPVVTGQTVMSVQALRAPVAGTDSGKAGFRRVETDNNRGIRFTNSLSERAAAENRVLLNGCGVALGDIDNDGLPDVYFCGLENPNALFRNLGDWKFEKLTGPAYQAVELGGVFSRGAVMADVDGDGWKDLLVTTVGSGTRLFINRQGNGFADQTREFGLETGYGSSTLALADVNHDGFPDLYVANNRADDIRDRGRLRVRMVNGKPQVPRELEERITFINGVLNEYGEPDQLYLNQGGQRFVEVDWTGGAFLDEDGRPLTEAPRDWGLSATFRDANSDGWPDLYVCNDFWTPDRFWINRGDGTFQAISADRWRNSPASSMGVDFSDLDGDGLPEFFAVDMLSRDPMMRKRQKPAQSMESGDAGMAEVRPQFMRNTLYRNFGAAGYSEIANFAGVEASDWSWSPVFVDVDLDGYQDIIISAGHAMDVQDIDAMMKIWSLQKKRPQSLSVEEVRRQFVQDMIDHNRLYPPLDLPVISFRYQGAFQFAESTAEWGMETPAVRHGIATADLDGDGDLDTVFNCLNSPAEIYENIGTSPRLSVRLNMDGGNTEAIGAVLILKSRTGTFPVQYREVVSGGRYASGCDTVSQFAAGSGSASFDLEVRWPTGAVSRFTDLRPGHHYTIQPSGSNGKSAPSASTPEPSPWMSGSSGKLTLETGPSRVDEFTARQPLLPYSLGTRGPGLAWFDWNGDGLEDLSVGNSPGGQPAIAFQKTDGRFETRPLGIPGELTAFGVSSLLPWVNADGNVNGVALLDGYPVSREGVAIPFTVDRDGGGNGISLDRQPVAGMPAGWGASMVWLPSRRTMAIISLGGPGNQQFPRVSDNALMVWSRNQWVVDKATSEQLRSYGLISDAVWSDLNQDGDPDLVLVSHWGGVHILIAERGLFIDRSEQFGTAALTGIWNGVATGDFNADGFPDLVLSNWGLNSEFEASQEKPLTLFHGEIARPGSVELVQTEFSTDGTQLLPVLQLEPLAKAMPFITRNFTSYRDFSTSPVEKVIGQRMALMQKLEISTLVTTMLLNQSGSSLKVSPLPPEAQYSPAFGISVADFNGDGMEDIFLAQNFYGTRPGVPRIDAGFGLMLRGHGDGTFSALSPVESGIQINGEQRAAAAADFNHDGRADLAVSTHGGPVHLFTGSTGPAGYTIHLEGDSANPMALGAGLRLIGSDGIKGPVRELQSSSSFLSRSSLRHTLHLPRQSTPSHVEVRWPGSDRPVRYPLSGLSVDPSRPHLMRIVQNGSSR
jgi:hypothetical protein